MKNTKSDQKRKQTLKVKDHIARNGRRFSLLYDTDGDGFPLFYPTAYTSLRTASLTANTQRANLYVLKSLYTWADEQGIDLELRFATKKLLSLPEVESLTQHISVSSRENDGSQVTGRRINNSLKVLALYLSWLFGRLTQDSNAPENYALIEKLEKSLLERKVKSGSPAAAKQKQIDKKLNEVTREALLEMFSNPYDDDATAFDKGIAFRNALALYILYDSGMRAGELLSLKLEHFLPARGGDHAYLVVERNHDDRYDRRQMQPVAKTLGRDIAISPQLEKMILEYLGTWRADIPNAGFEKTAFIFVKHKKGQGQGREITLNTFRAALTEMIKKDARLRHLHPHLLRHDWNYRFSLKCEAEGMSEAKERSDREYLMGWAPGSESAKIYDRRYVRESAFKTGLAIAEDTAKDSKSRKNK
ncbi:MULTISPECIES: site-specific integrase [unclassified Pseudomonas]|uniref:site-specific integrase n=1 Tax=unclassified Pseudomonas TaxID=196821 RepID=UPI002A360422|nr:MULTISPECIES: site-specific integrase [unclassified Pseudomonas]MDX9669546.1 site-specific integrase [Pseudomonas sp. P8_250]WPN36417.1 site-specific integrase [Pseudomonas sp. P8_139]WPN41782.1 site-specific integrase [Pseudomonas sp. P8_229]